MVKKNYQMPLNIDFILNKLTSFGIEIFDRIFDICNGEKWFVSIEFISGDFFN